MSCFHQYFIQSYSESNMSSQEGGNNHHFGAYNIVFQRYTSEFYEQFLNQKSIVMQPQSRSYFPSGVQQKNPYTQHHRPSSSHSPVLNNLPSYNLNKSYSKLPYNQQPYQSQGVPPRGNFSRSRVSMSNSHVSQLSNMMAEHTDIFPDDIVFLLGNEQKNINLLKEKVEKEKAKVQNDFAVIRTEIDHILEDIKISVQAELDLVYKTYITKYAELKGEVQQLRMLRKEILMGNQTNFSGGFPNNNSVSNKDLISEIEKDAEQLRNYKVYSYLGELQKQKLQPIQQLANQLVLFGAAEYSFYRNKQLTGKFKEVKQHFSSFIREVFENLTEYVITPELMLEKQREEMENSKELMYEADQSSKLRPFDVHYPVNMRQDELRGSKQIKNSRPRMRIGQNQQSCVTKWCEQIRLNRTQRVETDHSDSILCIYFINDQYIATGSKDASINIYSLDGKKVRKLKGHEASICCLSTFRNLNGDLFLASGSDHGCSSLILWDVRSWTIASKIQAHSAAVTAIIDLQDGRHVATGSYDKKITVYSTVRNQIVLNLNNNKTSVTGMIINADKTRLLASGLDKTISVWAILRKNGVVEDIVQEKIINAADLICQLQPSQLRAELIFCAARDGSLKVINISSGREEKSLPVSANSLIELVAIQREMASDKPILLTCSAKDNSLLMAKMDNDSTSLIKLPSNLGIDYGCGIGPKIVLSSASQGLMAIVNQRTGSRQFSIYQMILK